MATPLGAIGLGIDMAGDPTMDEITRSSLDTANMKLKFYRMLLTPSDGAPPFGEVMEFFKILSKNKKVSIATSGLDDDFFNGTNARLLLGVTYLVSETLLKGGNIVITCSDNILSISGQGPKCMLKDAYVAMLNDRNMTLVGQNPRTILPYYILCLTSLANVELSYAFLEHQSITFTLKFL